MNRAVIIPTLLSALALGLGAYHHVEIIHLRARFAQTADAAMAPSDRSPALEIRLRALESRAMQRSSTAPAPDGAAAASSERQDVAPAAGAGGPPAARRSLPLSPADLLRAHEASKNILDAARGTSLDLAANRRTWLQEFATAEGVPADRAAPLASVLETEFERREDVIAEVKDGTRTRQDGRAELRRLEASSNERARAILGADLFQKYLARRVASGIHDDGAVR